MIKLFSGIGSVLAVYWARFVLTAGYAQAHNDDFFFKVSLITSFLWVCIVGSFLAWRILLLMVRQLGSAVRGK